MDEALLARMYPSMPSAQSSTPAAETMLTGGPSQAPKPADTRPPAPADKSAPPPTASDTMLAGAPTPTTEETAASEAGKRLFPNMNKQPGPNHNDATPAPIREMRDADTDRKMYSPQNMLKDSLPDDTFTEVVGEGITDASKAAAVAEWREIAADVGMSNNEVKQFVGLYKQNITNPPTPEQNDKWRNESVKLLKERYGERADSMLGMADKLVKRDPRVQHLITHGGLANHPQVVLSIAEAALRQAAKGRL
jgi:hypothetical protein